MGITAYRPAKDIDVHRRRIGEIIAGTRAVTACKIFTAFFISTDAQRKPGESRFGSFDATLRQYFCG